MEGKVYVVTSGEYSDYGINAIFSTKELEQQFIDAFTNTNTYYEKSIEEWALDPNKYELTTNKLPYSLRINKEGVAIDVHREDSNYGFVGTGMSFTHDKAWLNVHCFANDEQHAIKIANEKRLQILASNQWGNRLETT